MKYLGGVVLLMLVLCGNEAEEQGKKIQLFRNVKSDICPNGNIYREDCRLCFCLKLFHGRVVTKCKSWYAQKDCAAVTKSSHCDPKKLGYDYRAECEGACKCNEEKTITICENLPCHDPLLWFHGYYNESEKGLPVFTDDETGGKLPSADSGSRSQHYPKKNSNRDRRSYGSQVYQPDPLPIRKRHHTIRHFMEE